MTHQIVKRYQIKAIRIESNGFEHFVDAECYDDFTDALARLHHYRRNGNIHAYCIIYDDNTTEKVVLGKF